MKIFTVRELNKIIKDLIDNEIVLEDITVSGELSSFSITRNIAYFTLKDSDNLLNCVMFGAKTEFSVGDMVQISGNVKYYPKGGRLTFNAYKIELSGQGELYKQFIELKEKLQKEGLFDEKNKIPIPRFISSIGVVTSATGAVLQDIKNVTRRRNPNLDIYVYDASVQGKFAVSDVIEGITYFDNLSDVDVIIVARGGGSLEDLMPFNNEELARVAFICNKPLISAVGHETDFSILDFVADLRAPTPSAAAELVTYDSLELSRQIEHMQYNIETKFINIVGDIASNIDYYINDIDRNINSMINDELLHVNDILNRMDTSISNKVDKTRYRVDIVLNTLDKLNPARLLKSGYSYVENENGETVNYKNININDKISVTTADVKLQALVVNKEKK
ncbi:MAG TPA: exodeoxyribonuclease VII large subunit [Candidatus Onthoplasma faecipullorum]|nr:exodeoxyribonuclease VII large subunit [Candidatus Onthoplasma faecipullorum]